MKRQSEVLRVPPATPQQALDHFEERMLFETDCWDVHASLQLETPGFVLLDVRGRKLFEAGHIDGAINIPNWEIGEKRLEPFPPDTLFVTYCAGPHCNGATKAAIRLARLRRQVKLMIGGVEGWKDEGFSLVTAASASE